MDVAIVGAGISGLATAFYVQRARPDWRLAVLDALPRAGGTMHTVERAGFRFEAGGNGFLTNKPDSLDLVRTAGAEKLLLPSADAARKRYVFTGTLHRLPESPPAFVRTRLLSWPQKLRVLGEVLVPPRSDGGEETLQAFGYRRLGKAFTDVFLDAMTAGIYASTPADLSVDAAFPLVRALEREHGGLFRGMLAKRRRQAGPGGVLTSFHGGVGSFIEHLRGSIRADWRLGAPVEAVERTAAGLRVHAGREAFDARHVVVATPAYAAAGMLGGLDAELSEALNAIAYAPIAVVGFGYRKLAEALDGFGLLTTSSAKQRILGVLWDSSIFPDRAPPGAACVRVMIGGLRNPELIEHDDDGLRAIAREGLARTMGLDAEPDVDFVQRWPRGIPCYRPGHLAAVDAIMQHAARIPGLHLGGNAYRGIAMNDCVRNARELAERIVAD